MNTDERGLNGKKTVGYDVRYAVSEIPEQPAKEQWIVVAPDGEVSSTRGDFVVDAEGAAQAIAAFEGHAAYLPVDWEHQTLGGEFARPDGQAPAAGWVKGLRYEPGQGLLALIAWNDDGHRDVVAKRYRYLSPTAIVRKSDQLMVGLHSVALTNKPAIRGMEALAASARLIEQLTNMEVMTMADEPGGSGDGGGGEEKAPSLLEKLKTALGLGKDAGADDVLAAIAKLKVTAKGDEGESSSVAASVRTALGLAADADTTAIVAAVEKANAHVGFVPAAQHNQVVQRVEALEAANKKKAAEELVAACIAKGKLNAADAKQMGWANKTAEADPEGFKVIMASAPVIIPQGKTQPPEGGGTGAGQPGDRTSIIAASAAQFRTEPKMAEMTTLVAFVNDSLWEKKHKLLTDEETRQLGAGG